ncbi:MAG: cob(I)yrinic acid a,c-diamide adenosyltransferase [Candidatus Omnitrophota bacterium]
MRTKGLIQIYTGNGKGKTTAAAGLVMRAVSYGLKVCWVCFFKDPSDLHGEYKIMKKLGVDTFGFAKKHPRFHANIRKNRVCEECLDGVEFVKKAYNKGKYDIFILDEVLASVRDGFLKEKELLKMLELKPARTELVLTGRGATKKIIMKADLVSRINKVKHPYDRGVKKRCGIDY